jgi:hypothetical protein
MSGGFRLPPVAIWNVAGTRALVEPPLLFVPPLPPDPEPPLGEAPPEFPVPEPPPPEPPLGEAPPLLPVVGVPIDVCVPDLDVLVVVVLSVVDVAAVLVGAVDVVPVAAVDVWLLLELEEPPQPPMINKSGRSAESAARRLTFSG